MGNEFYDSDNLRDVVEGGDAVYTVSWDSGGPGAGADSEFICRLEDTYAVLLTSENEPFGPFSNLIDAIKRSELNHISSAVTEVTCTEMTDEEIAAILSTPHDPGLRLLINGANWQLAETGRFVRVES